MPNEERRQLLQWKPLGMEHLTQYNELLRYVFQVTNRDLQNSGYEDGELVRSKLPVLQQADVIGWFNGDKLVSQLCVYPCRVNIHGKIFDMGGLTGVGTYPEYSNLRLTTDLIRTGLERMRSRKQWISYLYPYSVPFYRKKGWEIITERVNFKIRDSQLPINKEVPGYVERLPVTHKDVLYTYDRYARQNHGAMLREAIEWEEYWRWENEEERTAAVYYEKPGKPIGYLLYWIANDVFHIKEILYLNQAARVGLWNFISAHFSMVVRVEGNIFKNDPIAFLLEDSQITETIEPYYMGRIVDVAEFLQEYPFISGPDRAIHFLVTDSMASWNNGTFGLIWNNGEKRIVPEAVGERVELDIRTLTSLLMSFRSPSYFAEIEKLRTSAQGLEILEQIIPDTVPYFSDYF